MSWFDKFFNRNSEDIFETVNFSSSIEDIPLTTLVRWYLYDTSLYEENAAAELIGLSPISEEGDAKEREDSDLRLESIEFLMPFLDAMADISSNVLAAIQIKESEDATEQDLIIMQKVYKTLAVSTLIGAFSSAVDLGIILPNGITSDMRPMEDLDEQ
jgi:hypothetical protein